MQKLLLITVLISLGLFENHLTGTYMYIIVCISKKLLLFRVISSSRSPAKGDTEK